MPSPPRPSRWGGAIAGWELTRLARRGSPTVARLIISLLVFAALLITYLAAFPQQGELERLSPGQVQGMLSEFGQQFSLALLLVQAAVVLVITPLFVAGSIVEETERRTLEFLLATDLRPGEIVLGKLWPRLLLVFGVVLVGWPVLAVTQVWGGVDVVFVALGSLVVLAELWVVAGISAACAVGAPTLRKAMVRSYLWSVVALTLPVCTCPFGMIAVLADTQESFTYLGPNARTIPGGAPAGLSATTILIAMLVTLGLHLSIQFLIGLAGVVRATRKLRHLRHFAAREHWRRPHKPRKWEQHPPVPQGSPLLWKEIHLSGQTSRFVRLLNLVPWMVWLCVTSVFMLVGFVFVLEASGADDMLSMMNEMVRWAGGVAVGLMALMVGLHAAGSVSRERQQETLTDLLTVPWARSEILTAKWIGSLMKARGIGLGSLAIPLVGVIAEGLSFWAVVPMILAALTFLACAASFGLWLSVRTATVQRSTALWLLVVGLWVGGTFLAAQAAYMEERAVNRNNWALATVQPRLLIWDRLLNPLLAWSELTFRMTGDWESVYSYRRSGWEDGVVGHPLDVWPSALGVGFHGLLAVGFYLAAARRFEREGRA